MSRYIVDIISLGRGKFHACLRYREPRLLVVPSAAPEQDICKLMLARNLPDGPVSFYRGGKHDLTVKSVYTLAGVAH